MNHVSSKHLVFGLAMVAGNFMNLMASPASFSGYDPQVAALLAQMTLDEKIGQMVQADLNCVTNRADIQTYGFGSMLSGGDSKPLKNTPAGWMATCNELQSYALKTRLKIP